MSLNPRAGQPATPEMLIDVEALEREYLTRGVDPSNPRTRVSFGTSGHRGTPLDGTFTESHIRAITQAICEYRGQHGITGPLFLGKDTHAVSRAAQRTALEVLAAHGIETFVQRDEGDTPTPVISHAILAYNQGRANPGGANPGGANPGGGEGLADGIVITPSHNPPADGGFKYNTTNGGPADTDVTDWVGKRANELLAGGNVDVKWIAYARAVEQATIHQHDYVPAYVQDLANVIDMDVIRRQGLKLGVDPLGGASLSYWEPIRQQYGLDIEVVNTSRDPTFGFMTLDHDGKIRMDCSSPYAMAGLVKLKDQYQVAFGTDPDADRHGIVTPSVGLMNPNHFLAVAIHYLLTHRTQWPAQAFVGKTLVSSGVIDRVVADLGRQLAEVPVGFKWFSGGLYDGSYCFGGEESAGASFLRMDGTVWTTDKDGLLLCLLAAEITARTGKDPGQYYADLAERFGDAEYTRIDAAATPSQKARLKSLQPSDVRASQLAGEPILARLTEAPGNHASIGGLKVTTANGWFAARPSGTEDIYKIYAESFLGRQHLDQLVEQAQQIVNEALADTQTS